MTKNKLFVDLLQVCLIIIMVFFSVSLTSSSKDVSRKINEIEKSKENKKNVVIVKYKLVHGNDTIYIDRELDSILNTTEYSQFLKNHKK